MAKNRGGRPRKQGVKRQPDGRPKPEAVEPTRETMARRADDMARIIRLHPEPTARALAHHQDAGWYIGRLRLAGVITEAERDAALEWKELADEYARLLLIPTPPHAIDLNRREPSPVPEIEDEAAVRRFRHVKHHYERRWDMVAACGPAVLRAVAGALRDEETPVHLLREGLRALRRA